MKNHLCELKDYLFFDLFVISLEAIIYTIAIGLPAIGLINLELTQIFFWIPGLMAAAVTSCFLFITLLVGLNKLTPKVNTGTFYRDDNKTFPHTFKIIFKLIMERSPYFNYINSYLFFRLFYYRGMGSNMASTVYIAPNVRLDDPWGLEVGEDTTFGHSSMILSHSIEGNQITCEKVTIGRNVLIGARSVVLPGVIIEDNAMIAANSVVLKDSHIKNSETWGGIPAKLISKNNTANKILQLREVSGL